MNYLLGLDNGGTVTKASIYDANGREHATETTETESITPYIGFVERDMEVMWESNCRVIRRVIEASGVSPDEISGVAVCGHGKGLYLVGADGKPVRNGILSTDNRAWEYPLRWNKEGIEEELFSRTCQHLLSCQPPALLAWLRDHEPETLQKTQWIFCCKDYIRFRLTGKAGAEYSDISGTSLLNLFTRDYDDDILRILGLQELRDKLPPLCRADEVFGTISPEAAEQTGLRVGTPVAGGLFDINACALAVDALDHDVICMIAGTWSINEYVRTAPVVDRSVLMNSLFCMEDLYLVEECSPTSAGNLEWFLQVLCPELVAQEKKKNRSVYPVVDRAVRSLAPSEHVPTFLPFLMASNVHPLGSAAFVDISMSHSRAHLFRAVYEGVAFSHRYHFERLLQTRETEVRRIRLAGGVARSEVWAQMFADIMGLPVEVSAVRECGTLGCAICGAAAAGIWSSLRAAAAKMCGPMLRYEPDLSAVIEYEKKYDRYLKTIQALMPLWDMKKRERDSNNA